MSTADEKALLDPDDLPPPDQPINIPDDHYAALGKVADAWADLEFQIDQLIWHLLGASQALGACVTAQIISIHPRLSALRSLVDLWEISPPIVARLNTFIGEAEAMSTKRNRTIHDKRLIQWKTKEVVRFEVTARKELKFGPVPEPIDELLKFRDDILNKVAQFVSIDRDIRLELSSSPDKQRRRLLHIFQAKGPI
jgi:hypothetical protein